MDEKFFFTILSCYQVRSCEFMVREKSRVVFDIGNDDWSVEGWENVQWIRQVEGDCWFFSLMLTIVYGPSKQGINFTTWCLPDFLYSCQQLSVESCTWPPIMKGKFSICDLLAWADCEILVCSKLSCASIVIVSRSWIHNFACMSIFWVCVLEIHSDQGRNNMHTMAHLKVERWESSWLVDSIHDVKTD